MFNMVIAYLRISTAKQVLDNQRNEIESYSLKQSIVIDKWVTEVVSGKKKQSSRKLGRVLNSMKGGDTLLVTEVSRLSRTLTDIMVIMEKCVRKGIVLHCIKEGYTFDDTINSKVLCFAFGLVAEIERKLISLRTKEALALRRAEGVTLGRRKGSCPKMAHLENNKAKITILISSGETIASVCRQFNVCRDTFLTFARQDQHLHALLQRRKKPTPIKKDPPS